MNKVNENRILERCNAEIVEAFDKSSADYYSKLRSTIVAVHHAIECGNAILKDIATQYDHKERHSAMATAVGAGIKERLQILQRNRSDLAQCEFDLRDPKPDGKGRF